MADTTNNDNRRVVIELDHVRRDFQVGDETVHALKGVSFKIYEGEFVTIMGKSGSGKSTLLNQLGCLDTPSSGEYYLDGVSVRTMSRNDRAILRNRKIGFIFQNYNLLPKTTSVENVELPLMYNPAVGADERKERAIAALEAVGLGERLYHKSNQMSGGQMQRVAIARALINRPRLLLLDEPLGALDLKLRKDMQVELKQMQRQTGITFIYVTHDQEEALSMSDTIVVMADGKIQQIGTPEKIYNEPENAFVADFIGESNIVSGIMNEDYLVSFAGQKFRCEDHGFAKNEPVDVVVRPEDIDIVPVSDSMLTGNVTGVTFKGDYYEVIADIDNFKWMIETTERFAPGQTIGISIDPNEIQVMKKSEYSGKFGDYSTFSDEMEHLSDVTEEEAQ